MCEAQDVVAVFEGRRIGLAVLPLKHEDGAGIVVDVDAVNALIPGLAREGFPGRVLVFAEFVERGIGAKVVRRKNRGINGQPVLFYARRRPIAPSKRQKRADPPPARSKDITALLDGLNALGLTTATAAQVVEVTKQLFPQGTAGLDQAEVLRAVFLLLKRRNAGGNEGR